MKTCTTEFKLEVFQCFMAGEGGSQALTSLLTASVTNEMRLGEASAPYIS